MMKQAMEDQKAKKENNTKQQPIALPIFFCRPDRVKGIPIILEIRPLAAETPNALFQENEKPNFLPIVGLSYKFKRNNQKSTCF